LKPSKAEGTLKQAVKLVSRKLGLSEEEKQSLLPSGNQPIIYNRVGWAKFYLKKAGLLDSKKRGLDFITKEGEDVLKKNITRIDNEFLKQFSSFNEFINKKSKKQDSEDEDNGNQAIQTPDEAIYKAFNEINDQLKVELLEKLKKTDPIFFEKIVLELMKAMGYGVDEKISAQMTKKSHDGGIDGIINEDVLGLDKIYLQAKRYDKSVSREAVQAFVGALSGLGATKGVFITTGYFSSSALDYAKNQKIILIDGESLSEFMVKYNVGVLPNRKIEIKKIDLSFFEDDEI